MDKTAPLSGREHHLTIRALALAIAAMEAAPKEHRAESDLAEWEAMLERLAPDEPTREFYRQGGWRTLAAIKGMDAPSS